MAGVGATCATGYARSFSSRGRRARPSLFSGAAWAAWQENILQPHSTHLTTSRRSLCCNACGKLAVAPGRQLGPMWRVSRSPRGSQRCSCQGMPSKLLTGIGPLNPIFALAKVSRCVYRAGTGNLPPQCQRCQEQVLVCPGRTSRSSFRLATAQAWIPMRASDGQRGGSNRCWRLVGRGVMQGR
jgi:hypothetical protein